MNLQKKKTFIVIENGIGFDLLITYRTLTVQFEYYMDQYSFDK